ncbi:MAG: L,D-transpeptidase [Thermoleophilaceae bacterium]|nr:L,D-transpeptidase [Thermoleophilaceae bacterium]
MQKLFSALSVVAACSLLLVSSAVGKDQDKGRDQSKGPIGEFTETLLSNERDTSRWAFVSEPVSAFAEPGDRGRRLRALTRKTPDNTSELVLTLRERVYSDGTVWTEVRLPIRSQRTGWVRRAALGAYRVVHSRIEIDRSLRIARLYKNEQLVWSAPVAVGRKSHETPAGNFYVRSRLASADSRGRFGPFALGLSAQSKSKTDWPGGRTVGIHGTDKPKSIPGTNRDACIRVTNVKIRELFKVAPPGTPVKIL